MSPCGHHIEHEEAMCPCHKEGKWYPGLHKTKSVQQIKEGDPYPLHGTGEATPGILQPVLSFQVQECHYYTGESPMKGHTDD